MWDQPPFDQVERALARLVVLSNDEQFLARCSVVAGADVAHAAVAYIEAVDNGEAEGSGTLNDAATHDSRIDQQSS